MIHTGGKSIQSTVFSFDKKIGMWYKIYYNFILEKET